MIGDNPNTREYASAHGRVKALLGAAVGALLLAGLAQAVPAITWPEASYNPQPAPGDLLVPPPCNGAIAFLVIAIGPEPRSLADSTDLGRLDDPLPLGAGGQDAFLLGNYEFSQLQAAALRAYASGGAESKSPPRRNGNTLPAAAKRWTSSCILSQTYPHLNAGAAHERTWG